MNTDTLILVAGSAVSVAIGLHSYYSVRNKLEKEGVSSSRADEVAVLQMGAIIIFGVVLAFAVTTLLYYVEPLNQGDGIVLAIGICPLSILSFKHMFLWLDWFK